MALQAARCSIPGVMTAAWLAKSLPLEALRELVLAVVVSVRVTVLRTGMRCDADVPGS
jgi:hypothetical protein